MDNYLLILYADKQAPRLEPHSSVESAQAAAETYLNHGGWSSIELYTAHSIVKRGSVVLEKSAVQIDIDQTKSTLEALRTELPRPEQPVVLPEEPLI